MMTPMLSSIMKDLSAARLPRAIILSLLMGGLGFVTLTWFAAPGNLSMLWLPSGLALGALLLGGRYYIGAVLGGHFLACLATGQPLSLVIAFACANVLETWVAYRWLSKRNNFSRKFKRKEDLFQLLLAALIGSSVSALIGTAALWISGSIKAEMGFVHFLQWWQSESLGIMLLTPLILIWRQRIWPQGLQFEEGLEALLCLSLAALCNQIVFLGWWPEIFGPIAKAYWVFPFVAWAAIRTSRHVLSLMLLMTAAQALYGAVHGVGVLADDHAHADLGNFWFFTALLTGIGYSLSLLMFELRAAAEKTQADWQFVEEIIDSLPGAFFLVDDELKLVRWNSFLETVSLFSSKELTRKNMLDFIHEDDHDLAMERLGVVLAGGVAQAEVRMRDKEGNVDPYQVSARRAEIDGRIYIVGTAENIAERKQMEEALRTSEFKYRQLFDNTQTQLLIVDGNGIIQMINETNARVLGGRPEDFVGCSIRELDPENFEQYILQYQEILETGEGRMHDNLFQLADGPRWFHSRLQPLLDMGGKPELVLVSVFDITERKKIEEELRHNEELWKFALEGSGDSVWDWDIANEKIIHYSSRWKEQLGYAEDDELGDWSERLHPDDVMLAANHNRVMREGKEKMTSIEVRVRAKDGTYRWILARGMVVSRDETGKPLRVVGTNSDITKLKEHQHQLEHIAHFDVLTGLPNRLLLAFRLQQAMVQSQRRKQSLAVAYLDLDGFKAINDRHGHNVGDELLVLIAQRMKSALREGDTLARIGGDEFIAVLTDLDHPQGCEPVLQRLLQAASASIVVDNQPLRVSASIGVTIYPEDEGDAEQLIRHADQAMYQAKQTGKNRYHMFDVEYDAAVQLQHETIANIRRGLQNNEFMLYYQPKVNMRSGSLVGVEALIRWQHPEQGLMMPASFLPVIEEQQVSVELGEWVLDQALRQMGFWLEMGLDIPVSVNISAYHLQQPNFFTRLSALLAAHPAVPPAQLQLEILETSAFDDVMHVSNVMHDCLSLGIDFAIDDFGTGYSSLTYLKRLPATTLKIDRSFVSDMLDDPDDLTIVEGIVGLTQAFRREVLAEGVETVEHGELLLQLGCELAQGYGIAQPMTAAQLFEWAASWQPDPRWADWGGVPMTRHGLELIFARVRHRQWLRSIDRLLEGDAPTLLPEDMDACHWDAWLDGQGAGHRDELCSVDATHRRMHALGREIVDLHAAGRFDQASARRSELQKTHDELAGQLQDLLQRPPFLD
jgi:diguanylate cyclase (GGDEF)-like protein/PAS domain S-box-containing protein